MNAQFFGTPSDRTSKLGGCFTIWQLVQIAFLGITLIGCREAVPPLATVDSGKLAISSMEDLGRLVTVGMKTNNVLARIGKPVRQDFEAGTDTWTYIVTPFPWEANEDYQVVGIIMYFTNGSLAGWGGMYTPIEIPVTAVIKSHEVINDGAKNLSVSFYVVHDSPVESGRFVDTPEFPELGFISRQPDLTVGRLGELSIEERAVVKGGASNIVWAVKFKLEKDDSELFGSFTSANISKKVAILIGDGLVAAPIIRSPIIMGACEIEVSERSTMERIQRAVKESK